MEWYRVESAKEGWRVRIGIGVGGGGIGAACGAVFSCISLRCYTCRCKTLSSTTVVISVNDMSVACADAHP